MPACKALAQVDPGAAGLQTLLAAIGRARRHVADLIEVCTGEGGGHARVYARAAARQPHYVNSVDDGLIRC